jgi:beta-1,4-mannooligosaccharide/beta-1,4-mannosyl-N-acetylglucosamine phosphorylase
MKKRIFIKYEGNPIITAADMPRDIMYVFNPGAIKHQDEYILLMDAATLSTPIVLWIARSNDGKKFTPDPTPISWPRWSDDQVENCIYDPRITRIGDEYILMYASHIPGRSVRSGVIRTKDFITFERVEQEETGQQNRNSSLFPEKINGQYARLDRPMQADAHDPSGMYLSYSDDLKHWRDSKPLMAPRRGCWDSHKIGAGGVPIKTEKGWLAVYHGVEKTCSGFIYRLGVVLLDLEDPSKVIARGVNPVLWPEHDYERNGRIPNVTFAANSLLDDDGCTVRVYYGAADTCIGLATAQLDDLLEACFDQNDRLTDFFGKA